jgi:hypothetical protein
MPTGLGDEQLWLSATNDNTGTSTAFNDQSGNGNNGTASGTLVVADTSEGGTYAYDFDGVNDYIDIQGLSGQYPLGGSYSTSLWVNNDVTNIDQLYFNRYETDGASGGNDQRPEILMSDNTGLRTRALYKIGNGTTGLSVNFTYQSSVWYHIASTYDSATNTMTLYKNGASIGSVDSDWETNYAEIGRASISGGATQVYSDCKLDDIRSFTRVLTQAEITHLAEARGIEGPPPVGLGDEQLWLCPSINDSANDISGNGNNGTYLGGMGTVADTSNGGTLAYSFDGVNDLIDTGSTTVHQNTVFSYAFWINASASGSGTDGTVGSYDAGAGARGPLASSISGDSKLTFLYQSLGTAYNSAQQLKSTGDVYDSTWRHVACVFDGNQNEVKIYIDGSLDSSKTASVPNTVNITTALKIGAGSGGYTAGLMDDIRVYNRTLTQADVSHLSTSRGIEGSPYTGLGDEQLWLCPSLSDSANDISGNGNNGTYQGGMGTVADTGEGGTLAYDLNGSTEGIQMPAEIGITGGSYSMSVWINNSSSSSSTIENWLGGWTGGQANSNIMIYQYGTNIRIYDSNLGGNVTIHVESASPVNTWKHFVAVADVGAGEYRAYRDGVLVATVSSALDISAKNTYRWEIGYRGSSEVAPAGMLDDARIYGRVLTQAEITHLATSRGIEGSPSTATQYNAFITHAFKQLFQTRLR